MIRILMVEDHRAFSQALELLLGQGLSKLDPAGVLPTFSVAPTLAEGLRLASEEGPFDVAVVDLMLPDGDGTDVVRQIKSASPETRVVVLSSSWDLSGALEAGADEVIGKMENLQETVATLARLTKGVEKPAT